MKRRSYSLLVSGAIICSALVACLLIVISALVLQSSPLVPPYQDLEVTEIARIERLLVDSAPSNVRDSQLQQLRLTDEEMNLLIRYASELVEADRQLAGRVQLPDRVLRAEASVPVWSSLFSLYLNVSAEFSSTGDELSLETLRLGHLRIPGALVNSLARRVERRYLLESRSYLEITAMLASLRHINIAPTRLELDLMWEPALISQIRTQAQRLLISEADQIRIAGYYALLTEVIGAIPESTRAVTLTTLLQPLFAEAAVRTSQDGEAIAENRTLLLALASYVNEEDIGEWLHPEIANTLPRARLVEVRIQRRQDLAQHVASSAAIAGSAGAGIAQVLSSVKENYDARYRSGFSFSDLTANTAGMTMGRLATESESSARAMQRRMSELSDDEEYLPQVSGNRDGLTESDFNVLYRDAASDEYQARMLEIEKLVLQRPLFADVLASL